MDNSAVISSAESQLTLGAFYYTEPGYREMPPGIAYTSLSPDKQQP